MFIRILLLLLVCIFWAVAQPLQDVILEQITAPEDGEFFFPRFTPNGSELIFTKSNYTGLYVMNLSNPEIRELNTQPGAGYKPIFSDDGTRIFYSTNKNVKGRRYMSLQMQDIRTKEIITIETDSRQQVAPKIVTAGKMTYQKNDQLYSFNTADLKSKNFELNTIEPVISIEKGLLVINKGSKKTIFKPLGEGHYIWPSLSPDKRKLLFTKSGDGTYIADLEGNIEFSLGYANAPEWSPDGNWIAFMDDKDDGHRYVSSEIYISSIDGQKRFRITEGESIDMFPVWSPDGKTLAFHTIRGEIFLAHLTFEGDVR